MKQVLLSIYWEKAVERFRQHFKSNTTELETFPPKLIFSGNSTYS